MLSVYHTVIARGSKLQIAEQCNAVHNSVVQGSVVQCSAVQCNKVQHSAAQCIIVP